MVGAEMKAFIIIICAFLVLGLKPIDITASRMEMNTKEKKFEFKDNVVAKQADVTITCDELTAYYGKDSQQIERIVALGKVRIVQKERVASGERAEYDNIHRTLRLTGKPRVWQGTDVIEGEEIIVLLDEGKVQVKKAQAIYHPKE